MQDVADGLDRSFVRVSSGRPNRLQRLHNEGQKS